MFEESWLVNNIVFYNEESFIPGVTMQELKDAQNTQSSKPFGWFLQIALKFAVAFHDEISE